MSYYYDLNILKEDLVLPLDFFTIIGTRCKPYEWRDLIHSTYALGGFIARGLEWNWGD
jgi:hypothetical protein